PPLYIDQLVRFNLEGGSDPPARMADLIALRIERLPPDARRTLQALAVIGDAATVSGLRRLLPEIQTFDALTGLLIAAGLIEEHQETAPNGDGHSNGKGARPATMRTTHPLIRDVTLATIPATVRRELHITAVEDDEAPVLPMEAQALHAYNAQNAFEALMQLEQVGDRAASRGDMSGCVMSLRRGLDLARREIFRGELDDPVRAVLIFSRKLGEAWHALATSTTRTGCCARRSTWPARAAPTGLTSSDRWPSWRASATRPTRPRYLREALELAKQSSSNELVTSLGGRNDWLEG
ncbi:MAG: hypothetical protein WKG00_09695, partial [Polyangiaceae bacterium]